MSSFATLSILMFAGILNAQTPKFEVASIKPCEPGHLRAMRSARSRALF